MRHTRKKQKGGASRKFVNRLRKTVNNTRNAQETAQILFSKRPREKKTAQEPTTVTLCGKKCFGTKEHRFLDTDLNLDLVVEKKANNKNNPYVTVPHHGQVCETCLCVHLKKGHKSYGELSTLNTYDEYDREDSIKEYLLTSLSNKN